MKKVFTFLVGMLPVCAVAQNAELGLSGGVGLNTGASGSLYYKADKSGITPAVSLTFVANLDKYSESKLTWQLGLEAYSHFNVKNESTKTYTYFYETIGNDGKSFRYATVLHSLAAIFNAKYKISDVTYIYGGIAAGATGSRNKSNRSAADFAGSDITYKAPDGGLGFTGGIQAGITHRLTQRFAVNAQLALRYYNLGFSVDDKSYPGGTNFRYSTMIIPLTVGIRYRMGWLKEYRANTGRHHIVEEEIKKKKSDTSE